MNAHHRFPIPGEQLVSEARQAQTDGHAVPAPALIKMSREARRHLMEAAHHRDMARMHRRTANVCPYEGDRKYWLRQEKRELALAEHFEGLAQ